MLGVDGWIILGWICRRWDVGIWTGLGWPRIERWWTLVSAVMNLRVPWNAGNFLTSCKPVSFSRRTLHHGVSISHLVMLQPPCALGQCVCCITYQWPDDIPVGLRNDDFSWIWIAICKIFVGNSCLDLNLKCNISDIYCLHGRGIIPWWRGQKISGTLNLNFEITLLVAWEGFFHSACPIT